MMAGDRKAQRTCHERDKTRCHISFCDRHEPASPVVVSTRQPRRRPVSLMVRAGRSAHASNDRGVLAKLIIFSTLLGVLPIGSYFVSLKYYWNGELAISAHRPTLTHMARKPDVCCYHRDCRRQCCPRRLHHRVCARGPTERDAQEDEGGIKEGQVILGARTRRLSKSYVYVQSIIQSLLLQYYRLALERVAPLDRRFGRSFVLESASD